MSIAVAPKPAQIERAPAVRWERVACNLCGADNAAPYHHERLVYFDKVLDFDIVRCRDCGLVYTNPRLADHNATYLWASSDDPDQIEAHARAKGRVFDRALREIVRRQKKGEGTTGGQLLDVGCGSGHFLAAAQRYGFEVRGIESASVPADYARQKHHVPVINEDILTVDLPDEYFDVITAWDVIEHLGDPHRVLQRCAGWLRPGGWMALRFPSARWQKIKAVLLHGMLAGARPVFGAVMHLYFFDQTTFAPMASAVGLEVRHVRTTATEANTGRVALDVIKLGSHGLLRGIESISGCHLGNLEVYCQKVKT